MLLQKLIKGNIIFLALWMLSTGICQAQLHRYTAALPATDALGRVLPTGEEVKAERPDRFVGLFYWTWHTNFANMTEPFDVTRFLQEHPSALNDYHDPAWGGRKPTHFWGEPLFGYYRDTDEWVLRKHAEMLGEAGVDVIIFDCTNGGELWTESFMRLCEVFAQARRDGVETPQIAFLMAFAPTPASREAIQRLYHDFYAPGLYRDLWFMWKGKPLIMAYREGLPQEILDFFTFRPGQPAYQGGPQSNDQWGWLEIYPQNGYVRQADGTFEQMTVGVAQNWSAERGLTAMNAPNTFGRSYTHRHGQPVMPDNLITPDITAQGLNFQEQWERALEVDPEFVFVTGWNEWIMGRYEEWQQQKNAFPDEFSMEKSRDIEPMKGGYGDNYYYQLIANVRRFKGMPDGKVQVPITRKKIDWNYWDTVDNGFRTHLHNTMHRNSRGWGSRYLVNNSGRNDLTEAKVACDAKNIYFYIECADTITPSTDPAWMRLFIDVDCSHATGWEGYDYVVNRLSPTDGTTLLEACSGNSWIWDRGQRVHYEVQGNKMFVVIPRRYLGLRRGQPVRIQFKWSDNMQQEGDILDFLTNGDVAPLGRFNYEFTISDF